MSRLFRRLLLASLVASALLAALLAADWWFALPADATAEYVGRQSCAECHPKETELWTASDHDRAMDHATAETVLGDFNDCRFTHVAFEDLVRLSDAEVQALAKVIDPDIWAAALHGAAPALEKKVMAALSPEAAARVTELRRNPVPLRPSDAITAQQAVGDAARRLIATGQLKADFAVTTRFFREGGKYFARTDNRAGDLETFEVKYVFGVRPLQQYLVEFPDGRVQCLPVSWDTERNQWFHLYPGERIPHDDPLHWTRPLQNWNYMCAECHTTNLQKNFDVATNTYHTTWSEIDVSCETCHGPGSLHVKLAESKGFFWDRRHGYGLPDLKQEDHRVQVETCAPCHARRRVVAPGHQAGARLLDYFVPETLDGQEYYADGQILDEDYEYSSFIQSKMYHQKVRCSNCHDPHSIKIKFPDNRLCGQCHTPSKYDTPLHHHHPDSSQPGTKCVDCHMPVTKYMVVDPRRDHSLRIPRPDLTVALGIPNACNLCHRDQAKEETPQWAADQVEKWYGARKGPPHFAHAIAAGRDGKPGADRDLYALTRHQDTRGIVRASAIALLSRYQSDTAVAAAVEGLRSDDPLVRTTAVRSLEFLAPEELHRRLSPMLFDPIRAVRTEAARLLAAVPRNTFSPRDRDAFDAVLAEYIRGQSAVAEQPGAHLGLGVIYAQQGQPERAQQAYETSLRLDPEFIPARINLAMLFDQLGRKRDAEGEFRRVVDQLRQESEAEKPFRDLGAIRRELADARYSLGLLVAEDETRLGEAVELLGLASQGAPDNPRVKYNYGLALQRLNRHAEAEQALKAAYDLAPHVPDYLHALAILYAQQEQWSRAIACAKELVRSQPGDPRFEQFLQYLEQQAGKTE